MALSDREFGELLGLTPSELFDVGFDQGSRRVVIVLRRLPDEDDA